MGGETEDGMYCFSRGIGIVVDNHELSNIGLIQGFKQIIDVYHKSYVIALNSSYPDEASHKEYLLYAHADKREFLSLYGL